MPLKDLRPGLCTLLTLYILGIPHSYHHHPLFEASYCATLGLALVFLETKRPMQAIDAQLSALIPLITTSQTMAPIQNIVVNTELLMP